MKSMNWTVIAVALLAASCAQPPQEEVHTRLTEIAANPTQYGGQEVAVTGVIRYLYSPGVFVVGPEGRWPTQQQRLLVICQTPQGMTYEAAEGAGVELRGKMTPVKRETFDADFKQVAGAESLGEAFFKEWDGREALAADQLDFRERKKKTNPQTQPSTQPSIQG